MNPAAIMPLNETASPPSSTRRRFDRRWRTMPLPRIVARTDWRAGLARACTQTLVPLAKTRMRPVIMAPEAGLRPGAWAPAVRLRAAPRPPPASTAQRRGVLQRNDGAAFRRGKDTPAWRGAERHWQDTDAPQALPLLPLLRYRHSPRLSLPRAHRRVRSRPSGTPEAARTPFASYLPPRLT